MQVLKFLCLLVIRKKKEKKKKPETMVNAEEKGYVGLETVIT